MWSASACVSALLGPGMFDCLSKAVCSPRWQSVSLPSGCPAASCIADILGCPILPCNLHAKAHMGLGQGHGACLQYVEGASHVPTPQGHKRIHAALLKLHTANTILPCQSAASEVWTSVRRLWSTWLHNASSRCTCRRQSQSQLTTA